MNEVMLEAEAAVREAVRLLELEVDILHVNDWQTGLVPAYHKIEYRSVPRLDRAADAPQILQREPTRVAIVTWFFVVGIGFWWNAVPLELERRPAELLRFRCSDLFPPGLRILRALNCGHRAIKTDPVAESSAQQVAGGRLENPPCQVPQRDLDAADGRHGDAGNRAGARALHQHLRVFFDEEGHPIRLRHHLLR